jgi:hypothetical protein
MFVGSEAVLTLTPRSGLLDPPPTLDQGTEEVLRAETQRVAESGSAGKDGIHSAVRCKSDMRNDGAIPMLQDTTTYPAASTISVGTSNAVSPHVTDENAKMVLFEGLPGETLSSIKAEKEATPAAVISAPRKGKGKAEKRTIVITMVHGDVLILSGDEFDVCGDPEILIPAAVMLKLTFIHFAVFYQEGWDWYL